MDLWLIFITGLTVGGVSCLAVQGGLLASVVAAREQEVTGDKRKHALFATGIFLTFKFIFYTVLGFLLGTFGGAINLDGKVQTYMQLLAGIYMLLVAGNLLELHPIFRYAIIQPPRFLTSLIRNQAKSRDFFAPALLGAMTIFIPCGTTIAMEVLAVSSASGIYGALIMAAFTLGTVPLFLGIGVLTSVLGETLKQKFFKLAAVLIIFLGVYSIYGATNALGLRISLPKANEKLYNEVPVSQSPVITITAGGYYPNYLKVKSGVPVVLKLVSKDAYSCASAFRLPTLGIARNLQANETQLITFIPQQKGQIPFSCSMGMYGGVVEVL